MFLLARLSDSQSAVLDEHWRRIYTTNYDDSVEFHRIRSKQQVFTYDSSDQIPPKLQNGSVIHLHGSIRVVSSDNVGTSIVLGENSYIKQYLIRSPWFSQFQRDISFATHVFIIGYSLADYHISALLMENPGLMSRTVFVQGLGVDEVFVRRTKAYGRAFFIGVDGFAEALKLLPRAGSAADIFSLKGFRSISPIRDRKTVSQPTATEVFELLCFGNFNVARLATSLPGENYVIARRERVDEAIEILQRCRSLVVEGLLGNGKTLFLHLLAFELTTRGYECFQHRSDAPDLPRELEALRSLKKVAIFFEQYSSSQDALQRLGEDLPEAKLIIEIRTSTFEVRYHEVVKALPVPFGRISLNHLRESEFVALQRLRSKAGLLSNTVGPRPRELRDLLLKFFDNKVIRSRIHNVLEPIFSSSNKRKVLVTAMLIAASQAAVAPAFIRSATGVDPFAEFMPVEELAREVFEISSEEFQVRSSIFSEFVVQAFLASDEIADCVVKLILAAAMQREIRSCRILMSELMKYSRLRHSLKRQADSDGLIVGVYERLRYDERINREPLFWLQYAIAMTELQQLEAAQQFIETAYSRAAELPGFRTFQIDTQAFRILLKLTTEEPAGFPVLALKKIVAGIDGMQNMLTDESHRSYAVKVLDGIQAFVSRRNNDLSRTERYTLFHRLQGLTDSLAMLPADFKDRSGSEKVRESMLDSIRILTSSSLVNP